MPACNGPDRGWPSDITPRESGQTSLVVSAGVNRQPTGVGSKAELSARSQ